MQWIVCQEVDSKKSVDVVAFAAFDFRPGPKLGITIHLSTELFIDVVECREPPASSSEGEIINEGPLSATIRITTRDVEFLWPGRIDFRSGLTKALCRISFLTKHSAVTFAEIGPGLNVLLKV